MINYTSYKIRASERRCECVLETLNVFRVSKRSHFAYLGILKMCLLRDREIIPEFSLLLGAFTSHLDLYSFCSFKEIRCCHQHAGDCPFTCPVF
jgi:hypothetical protein